jgi:mannose-6-phosphate isomerase
LAKCPYFESYLIQSDQVVERDYTALRSFVIYVCFEGLLTLRFAGGEIRVQKGDVVLLPACLKQVSLLPSEKFGLLETYVPG